MAKTTAGKKKAKVFFERLVSNPPPEFIKVGRPLTKTQRKGW